jgi:hypothetical protein
LYNEKSSARFTCVYSYSGTIVRDASNTTACINATADPDACGFRLQTIDEWQLAARYIGDFNKDGNITGTGEYYPGNHGTAPRSLLF